MRRHNLFATMIMTLCICVTAIAQPVCAEEITENKIECDDDPGAGRLDGHIAPEFFGEQTRARAAVSYTHADKFKSGYTIQDGIDVSQWNGNIDWKKVKKDGIDFALVRMAYRGYGTAGNMGIDKTGADNLKNAVAAGVPVGAYIFSQATTESEAKAEADLLISQVKGAKITLPLVMDYEYFSDAGKNEGRLFDANLSKSKATAVCKAFCERVAAKGYTPMVYANADMLKNKLYASELSKKYLIWLANYTSKTSYTGDYDFWQYTASGTVDGINGRVDMNFRYIKKETVSAGGSSSNSQTTNGSSAGSTSGSTTKLKTPKLRASGKDFHTVSLSWSKVSGASGYQIQRYKSAEKKYITVKTITSGSTLFYSQKGMNAATTYKYRVRAFKKSNGKTTYSSYSSAVKATTKKAVTGKVKATDVNVRKGPGTSYGKVAVLSKGTKIYVTGSKRSWYKVKFKQNKKEKKGYMLTTYIKLL